MGLRHRHWSVLEIAICCCLIVGCCCIPITARPRSLPNICLQPPPRSESVCTLEIEGYYYDPRFSDCKLFVVGGCRASRGQSFGSRQDCLATCVHRTRRLQDLRVND